MAYDRVPGIDENYNLPPQVRQVFASSTEVSLVIQSKVDEQVPSAVAEAISNDPTIVEAAEDAINGVLGDRLDDLEETVYLGPSTFINTNYEDYSEIYLSKDFRLVGGILNDGRSLDIYDSSVAYGNGTVELSKDYRRTQPGADSTGLTPQYIIDEWSERIVEASKTVGLLSVGDSMTMDYAGLGVSVGDSLASELGLISYNYGYSGETPLQISWRLGVSEVRIKVSGGVIPASGSVAITTNHEFGWFRGRTFACTIMDINGVNRNVRVVQSNEASPSVTPTFSISITDGLGSARILDDSRIMPIEGGRVKELTNPLVLWTGRNDPDNARVLEYTKAFLDNHRDPMSRIMVRPIYNRSSEGEGTPEYESLMITNQNLKDLCGDKFYDDRSVLIEHGLEIRGITPTQNDTIAINEDRIPPSLMHDNTHLNVDGRLALARIDAIELKNRNWFV